MILPNEDSMGSTEELAYIQYGDIPYVNIDGENVPVPEVLTNGKIIEVMETSIGSAVARFFYNGKIYVSEMFLLD